MTPYLVRIHRALNESHVPAPKPTGLDASPEAVEVVQKFADEWKTARLKELKYTNKADKALRKALTEELRAQGVDDQSVRAETALSVLTAHAHVGTLLAAEDVSLAARIAALIDEPEYRPRLLTIYTALNELR